MHDNLRKNLKKIAAAVLCAQSYNPFKNSMLLVGVVLALPVPVAFFLFHSPHRALEAVPLQTTIFSLLETHPEYWLLILQPLVMGILFGIGGTLYQNNLSEVSDKLERLHNQAIIDPLTGISNRRYFLEIFAEELARSRRKRAPLSLIFIDLDHFKSINDRFGHQAGDEILCVAGEHLLKNCRPYDSLARWGGEEFIILLPDTDEERAWKFAERIRNSFLKGLATSFPIRVTTSIGAAQYSPGEGVEQLIDRADQALYHAKALGRNISVTWSDLQKHRSNARPTSTVA